MRQRRLFSCVGDLVRRFEAHDGLGSFSLPNDIAARVHFLLFGLLVFDFGHGAGLLHLLLLILLPRV